MRSSRTRLASLGAATIVTLAVAGAGASTATAAITCPSSNAAIHGRGATFQAPAHNSPTTGWIQAYKNLCAAPPFSVTVGNIEYNTAADAAASPARTGSGQGLAAMGANASAGVLPTATPGGGSTLNEVDLRFAGTDEAPNSTQVGQMESTNPVGVARDVLMFPAAVGAITIPVNLPSSCNLAGAPKYADGRIKLLPHQIENVFAGQITTWGALLGIPGCTQQITRVVRSDESGTTYQFKKYLAKYAGTTWSGAGSGTNWGSLAVVTFPTPAGSSLVTGNGTGGVLSAVSANDGSIGYAVLSSARSAGYWYSGAGDDLYWLKLTQRKLDPFLGGVDIEVDPADDPTTAAANKSNCTDGSRTRRFTDIPTDADPADISAGNTKWELASSIKLEDEGPGTDPLDFYTEDEYAICSLTYLLAWNSYSTAYGFTGNPFNYNANQAVNVHDYVEYILSSAGQNLLTTGDYDRLPPDINTTDLQGDISLIGN